MSPFMKRTTQPCRWRKRKCDRFYGKNNETNEI